MTQGLGLHVFIHRKVSVPGFSELVKAECCIICACFMCPLLHVFQAAELAPAMQADMEVKEAIQGTIQGENGEVVQIVTSVATWGHLAQHSPELCPTTQPDKSHLRLINTYRQAIMSKSLLTNTEEFNYEILGWRYFLCFFFKKIFLCQLLTSFLTSRNVEMFTENLKRLWYSKISCFHH